MAHAFVIKPDWDPAWGDESALSFAMDERIGIVDLKSLAAMQFNCKDLIRSPLLQTGKYGVEVIGSHKAHEGWQTFSFKSISSISRTSKVRGDSPVYTNPGITFPPFTIGTGRPSGV